MINMDFIERNKVHGKKFGLVIVDAFTKWGEILPTATPDALTVDCIVCMGPRPLHSKIVPAVVNSTSLLDLKTNNNPVNCFSLDMIHPVVQDSKSATRAKPIFDKHVARNNYTCVHMQGKGGLESNVTGSWCAEIVTLSTSSTRTIL